MSKLLTAKDLGFQVGAKGKTVRVGSAPCEPAGRPEDWPRGGDQPCGMGGGWEQCDGLLPAVATVGAAGTADLEFDPATSNFYQFQPYRLVLVACEAAAVETNLIRGIRVTAISYAGTTISLGSAGIPAILFEPDAQNALLTLRLPRLIVGAQVLTLSLSNIDTTTAAAVTGTLQGRAWRLI